MTASASAPAVIKGGALFIVMPPIATIDTSSARLPASGSHWAVTSMFTVVRLEGSGDTATVIFKARYPDGATWWLTAVYELRGDKIARSTMLFAPAFDPPDWREPYREPLERKEPNA